MTFDISNSTPASHLDMRKAFLAILISIYAVILIRTAWVGEDAYITFRVIANFLAHQGLVFNPGERVQAFTHPLWLFLMSVTFYFYRNFFYASIALSIVLSLAAVIILATRVSLSTASAALGISILVLSRAFVDYSTSGLENPLSHLLAILFLVLYFSKGPITVRRLFLLVFTAALGALNRPDAILFFLPALIHAFWKVRSKQAVAAVILGFLPIIVWEGFSVFYYGFPFPNTFYAKLNTNIPASELAQQGLFYLFSSLSSDPITMVAIIGGIVLAAIDKNLRHFLVAFGIIFYLAYVVKIGGDWMAGRFLTIPLVGAVGVIVNRKIMPTAEYYVMIAAVILIGMTSPYPTLKSGIDYGANGQVTLDRWGITDARGAYYQGAGLLRANRFVDLPNNDLVLKGIKLQESGQNVSVLPAIGYAGFYAGRGVHIIDILGLSDPLLARLKPVPKAYWFMAQFTRFLPKGYVESVSSGTNEIANKDLAVYYDKLKLVISGRLTDPRRLVEIWKLNFGYYTYLVSAYEDSLLLHVSLSDIKNPSNSTILHNEAGNIIFPMYGIKIDLDQPSHARHVEITLEDKAVYIIVFSRNGREIGRQLMEGTYSKNFETKAISVPATAVKRGFNEVSILPSAEGGTYLLGGFELKP